MIGKTNVKVKPNEKPPSINFIEYIESTGTQYIDTGIKPSNTFRYEMKIARTDLSSNDGICGSYTGSQWGMYLYLAGSKDNGKYGCAYGTQNVYVVDSSEFNDTEMHEIALDLNSTGLKTTVDGVLKSTTPFSSITNNMNIYLFKCNDGGASRVSKIKMYYFKMYDNNVLVRSFKPAKDSTGIFLLYDEIEGKCYYNQGTGSFIGGVAA